jgi:hypothetical protein
MMVMAHSISLRVVRAVGLWLDPLLQLAILDPNITPLLPLKLSHHASSPELNLCGVGWILGEIDNLRLTEATERNEAKSADKHE